MGRRGPCLGMAVMAAWLGWMAPAAAEEFGARVVAVAKGDSLTVLRDGKETALRLNGIDCPELDQPFGREAREFTSAQALGKDVTVKAVKREFSGRLLVEVKLPNGQNLTYALLRAGLAWWYRKQSADPILSGLEAEARAAKRGLWSGPAIPPEQWRRGLRDLR